MRPIYRTPFGSFDTWEAAAAACERADMDPCTCIEIIRPAFADTCLITDADGATRRLSFQIRVF